MTLDFILIRSCDIETKLYGICKTDQHFKSPIQFTASLCLIKIKHLAVQAADGKILRALRSSFHIADCLLWARHGSGCFSKLGRTPALALPSWVNLGKSLYLPELQVHQLWNGNTTASPPRPFGLWFWQCGLRVVLHFTNAETEAQDMAHWSLSTYWAPVTGQ